MTAPLLQVRDLTMRFGGLVAVGGLSFAVEKGTIHGLIGPQRRRQDDDLQRHIGLLPADLWRCSVA